MSSVEMPSSSAASSGLYASRSARGVAFRHLARDGEQFVAHAIGEQPRERGGTELGVADSLRHGHVTPLRLHQVL